MTCAVSCLQAYQSGQIRRTLPGAVLAPYVDIIFGGGQISVGNKSAPAWGHKASIRSFEYGSTGGEGGVSASVEIFDEQGGAFEKFMDKINKGPCTLEESDAAIDFGWIVEFCNGQTARRSVTQYGGRLHMKILKIEASYEEGKIKFNLELLDGLDRVNENRSDSAHGQDGQMQPLTVAIRREFRENCPQIGSIRYLRRRGLGVETWGYRPSDGGLQGPKSVWNPDQQNSLSGVRKWSANVTTDRKKGFTPSYNPISPSGELIFWEDLRPLPCDSESLTDRSRGTYLVNSGDCSPVLQFSPKAAWYFANDGESGGGMGSSMTQRAVKKRALRDKRNCRAARLVSSRGHAGTQVQTPPDMSSTNYRSTDQILTKTEEAITAHERAETPFALHAPIECELKIQGDPMWAHPILFTGTTVSIIVVNPSHITKNDGGEGCGDWIARPVCNPFYSDSAYMVMAVNHQIKEGSYETTLKVQMNNLVKTGGR